MKIYPAACPSCGSIAVDVLWSDETLPLYGCGSSPYDIRCVPIPAPSSRIADRNVLPLSELDVDELAELLGVASIAWAP